MTDFFIHILIWLHGPINFLGKFLLAIVGVLPGWLSNGLIAAIIAVPLLVIFKFTSNQKAIGRTRDRIKANMLAVKLYKDNLAVTFQSLGRVFVCSLILLCHAIVPMLVMMVPVILLLGQMSLWYQKRPLLVQEEAIVALEFSASAFETKMPEVILDVQSAGEITIGPVRVGAKDMVFWKIKALKEGTHKIRFQLDHATVEKELAIGDGFMRVSALRPGWNIGGILLHPHEKPFEADSIVKSIEVMYPDRPSHFSGTDWWLIYFFVVSLVVALLLKPFLKV
ncbi:MAG: hypothetical protein IID32_06735, partial [Planctomycetes bacterium]|nr:hypothetical protein [Planctomycetota bacterium]